MTPSSVLGAIHKGRPADPGVGDLRNSDAQLLFKCDSIVLSGRRGGGGSRNSGYSQTSFVNGALGKTYQGSQYMLHFM